MPRLSEEDIRQALAKLPDWSLAGQTIQRKFTLPSFAAAMAFVNQIAVAAERANHHPDITINYNLVTISLSTHSESGVTRKDVELAAQIETIYHEP
jgi:4a-hydroxytetrahydrobiopterin dehydratase